MTQKFQIEVSWMRSSMNIVSWEADGPIAPNQRFFKIVAV